MGQMVWSQFSRGWPFHFRKPSNSLASIRDWEWSLYLFFNLPFSVPQHKSAILFLIFSHLDNGTCGANKGGCDQICVDTQGGYYCQCEPGYVMDPSHPKKCLGKRPNTLHLGHSQDGGRGGGGFFLRGCWNLRSGPFSWVRGCITPQNSCSYGPVLHSTYRVCV